MTRSTVRRTRIFLTLAIPLASLAWASGPVGGQELPWLPKGKVRLDFAPRFWGWDSRYGSLLDGSGREVEEVEPLGLDLTADPLGSDILPYLQPLEYQLGRALQDDGYRVRLGSSQAIVEHSRLVFPFRLEVGITDWLTVGAMVPFIRPRTELTFGLEADSLLADVGLTPGTGTFLSTFGAVLDQAELNQPGNSDVIAARAFLDALSAAYDQQSVFPVTASATGARLQARLDQLRASLEAAGITGVPETVPLADSYLTEEDFSSLLTSSAMRAYPLENWTTPWTMGDVEVTVALRLLHLGFQPDSLGNLPFFRAQLGVGGLLRLGTGTQADPDRFLDQDPADGQTDLEGSVFGRVELGSRFGGWTHVRYGIQQEGQVFRRIARPTETLPPVSRLAFLNWTPGNYFELQANPSFYFTPDITFGIRYHYWSKGEDRYTLPPTDPEAQVSLELPPPALLNYETSQTLQEVGFNATYSTLAANARGEARLPMLVRFTYFRPVSGSGGRTPKGGRLEAGVTVYRTLWGGGSGPAQANNGG